MITRTIHYCWFGRKPLPPLALKCIASWRRYLPDYEIKEWNEGNFDVNAIPYTRDAYEAGKYAFVSDYARFWILYHYGGLYFDTDVEVIRPMEHIISAGPFMGREIPFDLFNGFSGINPGLGIGAEAGHPFYRKMLSIYAAEKYTSDGVPRTIVHITSEAFDTEGFVNSPEPVDVAGIRIYPSSYFCPIHYVTKRLKIKPETVSIHRYCGSWQQRNFKDNIVAAIQRIVPEPLLLLWNRRHIHQ